jgi:hypothetical protein
MRRRTLLRSVPAFALPGLAGCAALYGRIETDVGESHLHPARDPFVDGGLTADSDDDYRAWLFTDRPAADPILDAGDGDAVQSLRERLLADEYDGSVVLLAEARAPFEERFHLTPSHFVAPEWDRLADVTLPLERYPVAAASNVDADVVVATALVRYTVPTPPRGAAVHVYPRDAGRDSGTLARFDARTVG